MVVEDGTGITGANSYVSLADANAYFVGKKLNSSAWTVASDADKETSLQQSSMLLDSEFRWNGGGPLTTTQGLDWPQIAGTDKYGFPIAGVPQEVRNATCELAFYLLANNVNTSSGQMGAGLTKLKVDTIELTFDKTTTSEFSVPTLISRMLSGLGSPMSASGGIRTVRLGRV